MQRQIRMEETMTRLNAVLKDIVEDLKVRWIFAKARARAAGRVASSKAAALDAGATSAARSGETMVIEDRGERLRWAVHKAADVVEKLAGEPIAFVIVMQPQAQGPCQTVSNVGKEAIINLLLHTAEGLMTGRSIDVEARRAN
jgi:hypothetical protein